MADHYLARDERVGIRWIAASDLDQLARFAFTVSITEPLTDRRRLGEVFAATALSTQSAGAVAIVELATSRLIGTSQFYRAAPCIHGFELGYVLHEPSDRGKRFAGPAVRMFSDFLFRNHADLFRQQLLIETWNTASWKLAERIGFTREGLLRSSGFGAADPGD